MQAVFVENCEESKRAKPWKVDISAKVSESGRRERHFFKTKKQAEGFIDVQKVRLKNAGTDSSLLSPAEREASMQALKLLGAENPLKLVEIVRDWQEREKKRLASIKMGDLWDKFLAKRKDHSTDYLNQIKSTRNRFKKNEEQLVIDLTKEDVEEALEGFSNSAFNGYLRVTRIVLKHAVNQGWAQTNVALPIEYKLTKKSETSVLTNLQAARLLVACRRHFIEDLPYVLFGLFAGIRPDELERMTWEMVHLTDKNIVLPARVTKTGSRRVVVMEPTLCAWLRWFIKRTNAGALEGPIVKTANLRTRLRALRKKAKFEHWPQDVMRHTYASNHLVAKENIEKLLLNLGHTGPNMLFKHYHQAVIKQNASQFWSLYPGGGKGGRVKKSPSKPPKKVASRRTRLNSNVKRVRKAAKPAHSRRKGQGEG